MLKISFAGHVPAHSGVAPCAANKAVVVTLDENQSRAGQLAVASDLVDVPKLITAYYEDDRIRMYRISEWFSAPPVTGVPPSTGPSTSGISWRSRSRFASIANSGESMDPYSWGSIPTHSRVRPWPARWNAGCQRRRSDARPARRITPTPVISHAILTYNHGRKTVLAMAL